ncbi:MAG: universal stress protein [Pseudonocardia sp.]|uniref:universal stress protein n=1 Tax=unclassified Pseudonocardia TaxID=2619320 RepID=UPI000AC8078A|nr:MULTISPECIES: universal stress protein [unclassified Pseudonocardia]MBN9111300.1 universal stress protein [Pseudonocardia sp.]
MTDPPSDPERDRERDPEPPRHLDRPRPVPAAAHGFELGCDGPSTLVVGIDGSDTGWRAMYYAVGQARRQRSRVVAVYAERQTPLMATPTMVPIVDGEADEEFRRSLAATVAELGEEFGVATELVVMAADPVVALLQVAEQVRADAIVVGASEQTGHKLFGSVAVRTVKTGHRPVTVVP